MNSMEGNKMKKVVVVFLSIFLLYSLICYVLFVSQEKGILTYSEYSGEEVLIFDNKRYFSIKRGKVVAVLGFWKSVA